MRFVRHHHKKGISSSGSGSTSKFHEISKPTEHFFRIVTVLQSAQRELHELVCVAFLRVANVDEVAMSEEEFRASIDDAAAPLAAAEIFGMAHLDTAAKEVIEVWEGPEAAVTAAEKSQRQANASFASGRAIMRCKTRRRAITGWRASRGPRHDFIALIRKQLGQ